MLSSLLRQALRWTAGQGCVACGRVSPLVAWGWGCQGGVIPLISRYTPLTATGIILELKLAQTPDSPGILLVIILSSETSHLEINQSNVSEQSLHMLESRRDSSMLWWVCDIMSCCHVMLCYVLQCYSVNSQHAIKILLGYSTNL